MKKILLTIAFLFFAYSIFPQEITREYYLQKVRKNKTIAWLMLSGGVVLIATGASFQTQEAAADYNFTGLSVAIAGLASGLTSIHFFKRAAKYKMDFALISFKKQSQPFAVVENKLMRVPLSNPSTPQFKNSSRISKFIPAIAIKIML